MDAFDQLVFEHPRTLYMFYGAEGADGNLFSGYFKQARSLSEALADLHSNPGVVGSYIVNDAMLELDGDGGIIHVELQRLLD